MPEKKLTSVCESTQSVEPQGLDVIEFSECCVGVLNYHWSDCRLSLATPMTKLCNELWISPPFFIQVLARLVRSDGRLLLTGKKIEDSG